MSDATVVLDASALLALLQGEPGAERVADILSNAVVGSVTLSDVAARLAEKAMPIADVRAALDGLDLDVRPFDEELAYEAAALRPLTAARGLSLGDRACLALTLRLRATALTADRAWGGLDIGASVEIIRQEPARARPGGDGGGAGFAVTASARGLLTEHP